MAGNGDSGIQTATQSLTFNPEGGLFGSDKTGIDWGAFLGLGGASPVRAAFDVGGAVEAWIPFKGDIEVMRLQLMGEIATRLGLDVGLKVSTGETRATLPYDVSFNYPDANILAANPYFRLDGEGIYKEGPDAGFETDWPYFLFTVDAVFELSVLAQLVAGILGDNETIDLLDFDFATVLPLIDLDTRPEEEQPDDANTIFGVDLETLDIEATVDFEQKDDDGNVLKEGDAYKVVRDGTSIKAEFKADGVDFGLDQPDDDRKGDAKEDSDEDKTKTSDKKEKSTLEKLDEAFDNGPLATLTVNLPAIELEEYGTSRENLALDEEVSYLDGTRRAFDYGDGTPADRTEQEMEDREAYVNDVVNLNIDMDNILVELVKRIFTGGAGAPVIPGLEGTYDVALDAGVASAGADFGYNLFDADLEFSLPVNQTVEVTPDVLKTSLSFFEADADGTVLTDDDGVREATYMTARLPRYSIYFNEANTFWDAGVAQDLRNAQAEAVDDPNRVANDLALFVDFEGQRLPGAFTGQTGSVAGGVVMSTDGGDTWRQLLTNAEETAWLARSRPFFGQEPDLSKLMPRDDALFKYVIMTDDTVITDPNGDGDGTGGFVNLNTVFSARDLNFHDLVGENGIFESRLDVVTAPLYSTGLLDGVPSLDLYYAGVPNQSVWVEVEHEAAAEVHNDTSLDFNIDIILSALEFNLSAWVKAFGARFGLDFDFGPLWTQSYPIFATELAKLYDDRFDLTTRDFTLEGADETQEAWGFAIGAGGENAPLVTEGTDEDDLIDGAALVDAPVIDGKDGTDTITFAGVEDGVEANLSQATEPKAIAVQLTPYAENQAGSVHATQRFDTDGINFEARFSVLIDGESDLLAEGFGFVIRNADDGPSTGDDRGYMGYALESGNGPRNTVAVLFDTHPSSEQEYRDTSGNQIELVSNGGLDDPWASVGVSTVTADWDDRTLHHYWVSYDGSNLKVYVSRTEERPDIPFIDRFINIPSLVGDEAIFGFTASTGDGTHLSRHELSAFELDVNGNPELELRDLLENGSLVFDGSATPILDGGQAILNVENIDGSRGDDLLIGNDDANRIDGGEGNDTIRGLDGPDTLIGSIGNDILEMGMGPTGDGTDRDIILGGEGEDRLVAGSGRALLDGGEDAPVGLGLQDPSDLDIVDYREAPGAIEVNLDSGVHSGPWINDHELRNIEGIAGTEYNDTLTGDLGRSYFEAGAGNDLLVGDAILVGLTREEKLGLRGGNDRLYGQDGNDTLIGGPGADMMDGGEGVDLVDYRASPTSVFVDLAAALEDLDQDLYAPLLQGTGSEPIDYSRVDGQAWRGWAQGDKFRSVENVLGTDYDDIIFGNADDNFLVGLQGDDRIAARGGNDRVDAGSGDDVVWTSAQTIMVNGTFNPEDPDDFPDDFFANYDKNPLQIRMDQDNPVDTILGGSGTDFVILDWNGQWVIEQENELLEVYEDGSEAIVPFGLRYVVETSPDHDPVARLVGSLTDGIAALEFTPETYNASELIFMSYRRGDGEWTESANFDREYQAARTAETLFETIRSGDNEFDPLIQQGSYFRNASDTLVIDDQVRIAIATLANVEGLIGSRFADELSGSETDNFLYGNGSFDLIGAGDGDDVVSFGAGQPPQQIFSFPGRGYANVTAYDPASNTGSGAVWQQSVGGNGNGGGGFFGGGGGWDGGGSGGVGDLPARNVPVVSFAQSNARIAQHEAETPGDGSTLSDLRADLVALSDAYYSHALVEGGDGADTLDLRYDRGLEFLPGEHSQGAYVSLKQNYGHVAGQSALLFGIENVVGTDASDVIVGNDLDNVIETGAGHDEARAGDGIDTLSYANATDAVRFLIGQSSDGAVHHNDRRGDAENDLVSGFEVILGSAHSDSLGLRWMDGNNGDSITPFSNFQNGFQVVDGGGGDDRIVAMQTGGQFFGRGGDDRFQLLDLDWLAGRVSPENPSTIIIRGGAGVDRVMVSGNDLDNVYQDGIYTYLDFRGSVRGSDEILQRVRLDGVEFLETADQVVRLAAGDPVVSAPTLLTLDEDPWSIVQVFDGDGPSRLLDQGGTVISVPLSGQFAYDIGGGPVVVAAGMNLTAEMIGSLVFTPNQKFGIGTGGNNGTAIRAGAELLIQYPILDDDGLPVRDDDGETLTQERTISVLPGDLDGAPLGFSVPSDVAANEISLDFGKPFTEQDQPSDRVHLGSRTPSAAEDARQEAEDELVTAESVRTAALNDFEIQTRDLAIAEALYEVRQISFQSLQFARSERDRAEQAVDAAETDVDEAEASLKAAEQNVGFESGTLLDSLPASRLGDAQTYTVTDLPEGGQLWKTNITPAPGGSWTDLEQVFVDDKLYRSELEKISFRRTDGVITEDDYVTLIPDEILVADILAVPDQGVVFSSVSELNLSNPVPGSSEDFELQENPEAGTLFWRDEDGNRVVVEAGDSIRGDLLPDLLFDADIDRRVTISDPDELAEEIAKLNRPTFDNEGEDGNGASAVPPDPTALSLRLKAMAPEPEIDGVRIDLGAVSVSEALPFSTNPGRHTAPGFRAPPASPMKLTKSVEWVQWQVEDGGNGHFYALAELTGLGEGLFGSGSPIYVSDIGDYLLHWNNTADAKDTDLGVRPLQMASVGSAAENDFLWSLFADDPGNFSNNRGPRLGGTFDNDSQKWSWTDGTDWEVTFWSPGQPENVEGVETTLQYALPADFDDSDDFTLVPPLWEDVERYGVAPGFLIEVPALTTDRNDSVTGSDADERMDGGAGDDLLLGAAGNDTLNGDAGNDILDGGADNDTLSGGSGNDVFVMQRDGGVDLVLDFSAGDRIDVSDLGLLGLSELRLEQRVDAVALHAADSVMVFQNVEASELLNPQAFVGGTVFVGASVEGIDTRALSPGDQLHPDELPGLRYRADQDSNGDAGEFRYVVRDPWSLENGLDLIGGAEPRDPQEDGGRFGAIDVELTALNDAPRAADRAYLVSAGATLYARDPGIALSATDPEGDPLTFSIEEGPTKGVLNLQSDGTFTYRPNKGFVGDPDEPADDSFRYRVSDGLDSVVRTVQLDIADTSAERSADPDAEPNSAGFIEIGGLTSNDRLGGTDENDHLFGGHGADVIAALAGDDSVEGSVGNDTLKGNEGNDTVGGGAGSDMIEGGSGDDQLSGGGHAPLASGARNTAIENFGQLAGGWKSQNEFPRLMGDIDGDGAADIVGFGARFSFSALSDGTGTFDTISRAVENFSREQGWSSDEKFPRRLGDVNGDGLDDIIGFGSRTTYTALSNGDGTFGEFSIAIDNFAAAQGWRSTNDFPRIMGDVNGDGLDDIIGFGGQRTFTALAQGDGTFGEFKAAIANFSRAQGWSSNDTFLRLSGDVDGDGNDDIIGFGSQKTFTALSNGDGTFGQFKTAAVNFSKAQGWGNNDATPRLIGDVNGDGIADIVGFGGPRTFAALGVGNGTFESIRALSSDFSRAEGWNSFEDVPRALADLDGDGVKDLVGFSADGVRTRLVDATTDIFMFEDGFGVDEVTDFDVGVDGDRLDVRSLTAIRNFEDVMKAASQDGADTVIDDGANSVRLIGVQRSDLTDADFLFV